MESLCVSGMVEDISMGFTELLVKAEVFSFNGTLVPMSVVVIELEFFGISTKGLRPSSGRSSVRGSK